MTTTKPHPSLRIIEDRRAQLDPLFQKLHLRFENLLQCGKGCHECCVDELTVFEVEAQSIQARYPHVLKEKPHPPGKCAFLNFDGECRVYEARPYVCRSQGLPLRWVDEHQGEWVEFRDICPLNDENIDLEKLEENHCWTLGPEEEFLATTQSQEVAQPGKRVELRSLFTIP
ncbi:MAG: YkgJ family cysteine cluster protein [Myxococcota bacterium]|nr:YkgJ family cysteine cluster protein [Myxococcota bacterium]